MIGFYTEFGLGKENGRITLTLANLSKGQPPVTRFILNPVVRNLLYSLARAGGLRSYSPRLQPAGFYRPLTLVRAGGLRSYGPTLEGAGFYPGLVFSGSV